MKYFVSIENTEYFRWQAELLIESFNLIGLEDDLIIAVAESELTGDKYHYNLNNHKNKFLHENVGLKQGLITLNKIFSLYVAATSGLLGDEFTVLHPDMLIVRPMASEKESVVFAPEETPEDEILKKARENREIPDWMSGMGKTMVFKDFPTEFFKTVLQMMCWLKDVYGSEWDVQRGAWMSSAMCDSKITFQQSQFLEMPLLVEVPTNCPIIHYRHGITPYFNKRNYKNNIVLSSNPDPLYAMSLVNPNSNTNYLINIIKSYENKIKSKP